MRRNNSIHYKNHFQNQQINDYSYLIPRLYFSFHEYQSV